MQQFGLCFGKVKKDCLKFIKSQETKTDKFKNKEKMIKSFLIPLCFWISKKVDKTILGALAVAQRYPGLRLIFRRMSSAFTAGRLSKIGDIPKVKGFQSATNKLTKVEQNWYARVLVPIGIPDLAVFEQRAITVNTLQLAPDVAKKVVNVKRLEKNLQQKPKQ